MRLCVWMEGIWDSDCKRALKTNEQVIKAVSPFPLPPLRCQPTRLRDMLEDTVPAQRPCPCLQCSSSHLGVLITALNFFLHSRPCPPQTNNHGGRMLIIIASEKSDCLLLKLPTGHAGFSPSRHLSVSYSLFPCLSSVIQTKILVEAVVPVLLPWPGG